MHQDTCTTLRLIFKSFHSFKSFNLEPLITLPLETVLLFAVNPQKSSSEGILFPNGCLECFKFIEENFQVDFGFGHGNLEISHLVVKALILEISLKMLPRRISFYSINT